MAVLAFFISHVISKEMAMVLSQRTAIPGISARTTMTVVTYRIKPEIKYISIRECKCCESHGENNNKRRSYHCLVVVCPGGKITLLECSQPGVYERLHGNVLSKSRVKDEFYKVKN